MYNKLQYISQGETIEKQFYNIHQALDNGCNWIQLRFKTNNIHDVYTLAEAVKTLCSEYLANFIINDNVHLAQQIAADGVHLGLSDMSIPEARTLLGNTTIIGATANSFENIAQKAAEGCDYIGLGPLRYTKTKQNLSPILGIEGYRAILEKVKNHTIDIPIYAIGGITIEDVEALIETGIYGIAVSGLITQSENPSQLITQLNEKLYVTI